MSTLMKSEAASTFVTIEKFIAEGSEPEFRFGEMLTTPMPGVFRASHKPPGEKTARSRGLKARPPIKTSAVPSHKKLNLPPFQQLAKAHHALQHKTLVPSS